MNKSTIISGQLVELENSTSELFRELLKNEKEYNFLQQLADQEGTDEEILDNLMLDMTLDALPMIEMRSNMTGFVFHVYVLKVHQKGIDTIDVEEQDKLMFQFKDVASLEDSLVLLHEMETINN